MKNDSEAYVVFIEQGSSASQMTAAKVMDVIARLPDCDGQAADAISAYTQVNGCSKLLKKFPNQNVRSHGKILKILSFLLNETCAETHSQDS